MPPSASARVKRPDRSRTDPVALHRKDGGANPEEYYLRTVARGSEEYYTGSGESAGTWVGEGSRLLGLAGEVDPITRAPSWPAPSPEGEILVSSRLPDSRRICGFDPTFSAPKSVYLLYGLSGPDVSAAVGVAHQEAMADAFGYLERHALRLRRGPMAPCTGCHEAVTAPRSPSPP